MDFNNDKALLVMDMPGNCVECPVFGDHYGNTVCKKTGNDVHFHEGVEFHYKEERPSWCPLIPMPEKKAASVAKEVIDKGKIVGWNSAIDTILGKPTQMERHVTLEEAKEMQELTGLSIVKCMKALRQFKTVEETIKYYRSISDEPYEEGLTKPRADVLDKNGNVIASFDTPDDAYKAGYSHLYYKIRVVTELGFYIYVK